MHVQNNSLVIPVLCGAEKVRRDRLMLSLCFRHQQLSKGDVLLLDSAESMTVYCLVGSLKLLLLDADGNEKLLFYMMEGNASWANYRFAQERTLQIVAGTDCEICLLHTKQLLEEIVYHQRQLLPMLEDMEKRFTLLSDAIFDLATFNNTARICRFLQVLADSSAQYYRGYKVIPCFPTHNDIALFTGVHKVNISKCLTRLTQEGIIAKEHGQLVLILDYERLRALACQR